MSSLPISRIKTLSDEKLSSLIEKVQSERGKWKDESSRKTFLLNLKAERRSRQQLD